MIRKIYLTFVMVMGTLAYALAQGGAVKVTVVDGTTKETVPFATVVVMAGNQQVAAAAANIDGEALLKPIQPGVYNIKVSYTGYAGVEITNVNIIDAKTAYVSATIMPGVELKVFEKVGYTVPLIDPNASTSKTVTKKDYDKMATKNINSVVAQSAGVAQVDEGDAVNIRGGRSESSETFIDGMRVIGSAGLPQSSIEQVSVITGGVPASFGDATSGIVNITTRGPQSTYFGGVEAISSELTDKYGYNFLGFSVGGPLWTKKDSTGNKRAVLGFIVSGEISTDRDPDPSAIGMWKVKDDVLADLEKNPLRRNPNGSFTLVQSAQFITKSDMEQVKAKQNVRSNFVRLNGKLDYKPTENLNVTFGGSVDYNNRHDFIYEYALFNPVNNAQSIDKTWRVYGRLQQKFNSAPEGKEEKSAANLKNAYYTLQASYTKVKNIEQDDNHKDKFFDYGYLGQFKTYKQKIYAFETARQAFVQNGWQDTLVTYTPDTIKNPTGAAFASSFYSLQGDDPEFAYDNIFRIQANGGLINGDRPNNVNGLWYNTGRQYGGYSIDNNSQFRVNTSFSADVKNHALQVGFEYEQRSESRYSISPIGLWGLMYQLANKAVTDIDLTKPTYIYGGTYDTITYDRGYNANEESQFSKNLRKKLNVANNEWIDIHNMKPEDFSLDMFSADDLLNNGNSYINYYGYDYLGNKVSNVAFEDFFTQKDADGNLTRPVGSFNPIYMAGYIQDRFDFKDLKFNVGLRIDRFDANQKVLKDPFSLYGTRTAGDVTEINGTEVTHPSNIGGDYVVYVNSITDPTQIVGYRNNNRWYNSEGVEVVDPRVLAQQTSTGQLTPYLINAKDGATDETSTGIRSSSFDPKNSFKDYDPQINFMPRVAFSFPISDMANFFAHYDVLTQRPPSRLRMNIFDYYFMDINTGGVLNNPNLKPEKTIDYELGFTQVLNEQQNSALTLSAFYRELRNMIQITRFSYAYPVSYTSYGNIDFGTVTGFSVAYDLRRTNNVTLNANYTLSFANGTGSSDADAQNIISNSTQPNLRNTVPLSFDQRHNIVANVDYSYGDGKDYNGPKLNGKKIFANAGANLTFRATSGTPYSRQGNISQEASIGASKISVLSGSLNGSRLPFQYRFDLRVQKSFPITFKKASGEGEEAEKSGKKGNLNIYLQVLNLLNAKNIIDVYRATGNPSDDGFLTDAASNSVINSFPSPQAFIDQYSIKVNNPNNYSLPRRMRIGVTLDF
ncbi:MAG TPA: TonB-dependent receptor plug domain-containing protein [Bacteroidia bacterium]|nr:TonB-dependent receptor plug domain-containing protein [Bacteroidia bacterium]